MKMCYSLLLIYFCAGIFNSCKTYTYSVEDLNGRWTIIAVKDEPVQSAAITPFLEFDVAVKRVHGNTSCNVMNAPFESDAKDKTSIRFIAPVTTMMACINMETEAKILRVMTEIAHVRKGETSNRVKLVDKNGNTMLLLEKL